MSEPDGPDLTSWQPEDGNPYLERKPEPREAEPSESTLPPPEPLANEGPPDLKPGEEFNFERFTARLGLAAGLLIAARGAAGVWLPGGFLDGLGRRLPMVGEVDADKAFIVLLIGGGVAAWNGMKLMMSNSALDAMAAEQARRYRRGRGPFGL